MTTIQDLEERLNSFERSLIQMGINNTPIVQKVDETAIKVDEITPYEDTKTAYIDDTEVVFFNAPEGALVVSFSNGNLDFSIKREDKAIKVTFEPLEEVVTITIKIQ